MCFGWRGRRPLGYILVPQRLSPLCLAPGVFARLACLPRPEPPPPAPPARAPLLPAGPGEAGRCSGTPRCRRPAPHLAREMRGAGPALRPSAEAPRAGRGGGCPPGGAARAERPGGRGGGAGGWPEPGGAAARAARGVGGGAGASLVTSLLPAEPERSGAAEGTRRFLPGRWRRGGTGPREGPAEEHPGAGRPVPARLLAFHRGPLPPARAMGRPDWEPAERPAARPVLPGAPRRGRSSAGKMRSAARTAGFLLLCGGKYRRARPPRTLRSSGATSGSGRLRKSYHKCRQDINDPDTFSSFYES